MFLMCHNDTIHPLVLLSLLAIRLPLHPYHPKWRQSDNKFLGRYMVFDNIITKIVNKLVRSPSHNLVLPLAMCPGVDHQSVLLSELGRILFERHLSLHCHHHHHNNTIIDACWIQEDVSKIHFYRIIPLMDYFFPATITR